MFFSTIKDSVDPLVTPSEPKRPSEGKQDVAKNNDTSAHHKQSQQMEKAWCFSELRRKARTAKGNNDWGNTIVHSAHKPNISTFLLLLEHFHLIIAGNDLLCVR